MGLNSGEYGGRRKSSRRWRLAASQALPWPKGYDAVQAARGATEFGSMRRVGLIRGSDRKEYDLTQTKFMNIILEPNDTILVPQKDLLGR